CARAILHGLPVPRDSLHEADNVHVTFDPLESSDRTAVIRVRVTGLRDLGAFTIQLDYPGDRWRALLPPVLESKMGALSGGWFPLRDRDDDGRVHIGGLRVGDAAGDEQVFDVWFGATGTPQPGDRVEAVAADLAAVDGRVVSPKGALPSFVFGSPLPPPPL